MMYNDILKKLFRGGSVPSATDIKEAIKETQEVFEKSHASSIARGLRVMDPYTTFIDSLICGVYTRLRDELSVSEETSLVALGGYGRRELNIHSDIDLMLLYGGARTPLIEELTEKFLYILWDTGLEMGFSIRSVGESIEVASGDLKTRTALLDRRFICGEESILKTLDNAVRVELFSPEKAKIFVSEKINENTERHSRYGGSIYMLEPNVKEGYGGLRDLHTSRWILQASSNGVVSIEELLPLLIDPKELLELNTSLDFLLWVRNELHFATGRKNDQLTFDHQERVALKMGYKKTSTALAVENFMHDYYIHASNISHYADILYLRHSAEDEGGGIASPDEPREEAGKDFFIVGAKLMANSEELFIESPVAMMKAFEYSAQNEVQLSPQLKDQMLASIDAINDDFRNSTAAAASFLAILKGPKVYDTLAEMHNLRLLNAYIPEFGDITCKVQHDMYHIYTVDIHTLFAVREIERLRGENKTDFFLLATIFEELVRPELLYLSVIFHDIGKNLGKGHAESGARLIPQILKRLKLKRDDIEVVKFLVRHHLILANTAQYRDIHDEKLTVEFAKTVGSIEKLNMLYLLTFADVRAVGPDVWSQWKGTLFQELYFKVLTVIDRGGFDIEEARGRVKRVKKDVLACFEKPEREEVERIFKFLPQRYFLSNNPWAIASHIKTVCELDDKTPLKVSTRQDVERDYTEVVVCTRDTPGLFSMLSGVMAANSVNILGAQINTLQNGIVLDIMQVKSIYSQRITDAKKLVDIEEDLTEVITGVVRLDSLIADHEKPSILDMKPTPDVPTRVLIDNEVSETHTVLDIHTENRIGLLYKISIVLMELGLYIEIAKISTKGELASDIFYIKDIFGQKIFFKEKLDSIVKALHDELDGDKAK